jgi:RimJ/RimL family protein N-acetyltransferase
VAGGESASVGISYPNPELSDDVVRLRPWDARDIECVREASGDPRITEATTVPAPFTVGAAREFIARQAARAELSEGISLVITDLTESDRARGLLWLGARPRRGVAGVGFWIVPSARRRGLATRAVRLGSDWALSSWGMARLEALVEPGNEASQRTLVAAGFEREGLLRSFLEFAARRRDALVYARVAPEIGAS